jgi:CRISPR-associated protein Cst2
MSKHLFGLIVTPYGTAANNRGENEGNITTLQKILWNGEIHTCISAEAIRFAIRYYWQQAKGEDHLNRKWKEFDNDGARKDKPSHEWADHEFKDWQKFIDDDVLGFMSAEAAKEETNPEESSGTKAKKSKGRGKTCVRRARLEITRAVSLTPFVGDITFNAATPGATPSASSTGKDPVPYGTEMHATRYQYGFALTPEELKEKNRVIDIIDAIVNLSEVAGNHARFLFDFSPDSIIFRWTDDFAPRILYGFALDSEGRLTMPEVVRRLEAGDIKPDELVVGGSIAAFEHGKALKDKKALVENGVKAAAEQIKKRIRNDL